jgi:pyruvate dehydrogenase E1 component alpha subunit
MDVTGVAQAVGEALGPVREGAGPAFVEFVTYRFRAHSMYDPERYRDREEVERWRARDPLLVHGARLRSSGALDDGALAAMERSVAAELDGALAQARAGAPEDVATLARHVVAGDGA